MQRLEASVDCALLDVSQRHLGGIHALQPPRDVKLKTHRNLRNIAPTSSDSWPRNISLSVMSLTKSASEPLTYETGINQPPKLASARRRRRAAPVRALPGCPPPPFSQPNTIANAFLDLKMKTFGSAYFTPPPWAASSLADCPVSFKAS